MCVCLRTILSVKKQLASRREKIKRFLETALVGLSMHITTAFFLTSLLLCISSISRFVFLYYFHRFPESTDHMEFYLFVLNCISRWSVKLLKELCSIHSCSCLCTLSENYVALSDYLLQA